MYRIYILHTCFYIHTQAWVQYSQTTYHSIVIVTSNTPRNLSRLTSFVVAPPQVRASKDTPSKIFAAAAILTFWSRLVWHREDQSKIA